MVIMLVMAVLALAGVAARAVVRLYGDESRRPADVLPARWHLPAAYGLLCAGLLLWAVFAAVVEPTTREALSDLLARDPEDRSHVGETERLAMFGREARWAAILLGAGGLVVLARARRRRAIVAAFVVAWVAADLVVDVADAGPSVVAVVTVVLGALAVAAASRARRDGAAGLFPLVYSGASTTAAFPLVLAVGPWSAQQLPGWVVPLVAGQSALLVVAGMVVALAAAPAPTPRRTVAAVTVAAVGALAAAGHAVWEFGGGDEVPDGRAFLPGVAAVAVVVTAGAFACAGPLRFARDRWAWVGVTAALGIIAGILVAVAFGGVVLLQFVAEGIADGVGFGTMFLEGPLYVLPGVLAGALLGVVALLPVARSHRVAVPREPEPDEPQETPRPVALPGVAEVLEWPPPKDGQAPPVLEPGPLFSDPEAMPADSGPGP
jgi:hypothetical protein